MQGRKLGKIMEAYIVINRMLSELLCESSSPLTIQLYTVHQLGVRGKKTKT